MASKCSACLESIPKKEELSCSHCPKKYHYACLSISDANYKKMSVRYKDTYKCPACLCIEKKSDNSNTPAKPVTLTSPERDSDSKNLIKHIENILDKKLLDIKNCLITELRQMIKSEVNNCMSSFSTELHNLAASHSSLQEEHIKLSKECSELQGRVLCLEESLVNMSYQYSKQQQWARQQNIEIFGVPELKNESPVDIVIKIGKHVGINLNCHDIEFASRIQPYKPIRDRPRVIVAKMRTRLLKDNILSGLRRSHGITTSDIDIRGEPKRIFVNDHLTPENKALFKKCKNLATELAYKFVWTKNCLIFVRKNEKSPALSIASEKDLVKII